MLLSPEPVSGRTANAKSSSGKVADPLPEANCALGLPLKAEFVLFDWPWMQPLRQCYCGNLLYPLMLPVLETWYTICGKRIVLLKC